VYPSTQNIAIGTGLLRDSGYKPGDSGSNRFNALDKRSGHSGHRNPEIPALYPEYPGLAGEQLMYGSFEWYLWLTNICLGSLEH